MSECEVRPFKLSQLHGLQYTIVVALQPAGEARSISTVKFVYWEEDGAWLGYLQDFPDYWTQGQTLEDLREHLRDLYAEMSSDQLPGIRKVDDLVVS